MTEAITYDWLAQHGFEPVHPTDLQPRMRRIVAEENGESLCLHLAVDGDGYWFCWLHEAKLRTYVHVRRLRYQWELIRLCQALSGKAWI